jgi:hypothetical protein
MCIAQFALVGLPVGQLVLSAMGITPVEIAAGFSGVAGMF